MSDTKPFKAWLADWFYPSTTAKSTAANLTQTTCGLHQKSKPVKIIQSLCDIRESPVSAFTRQNSTGNFDSLTTSTYPPRTFDSFENMGNSFRTQYMKTDQRELGSMDQNSHFTSLLSSFRGKFNEMNLRSSLPSNLNRKMDQFTSDHSGGVAFAGYLYPLSDIALNGVSKLMKTSDQSVNSSQNVVITTTNSMRKFMDSEPTFTSSGTLPEINIMSSECYKEVQLHSKLNPITCSKAASDADVHANAPQAALNFGSKPNQTKSQPTKPMNPVISQLLGYNSETDSEVEFTSESSEDSDSDSFCSDLESLESFEDDSNSSNSETDEETDSDDTYCPWERVISCRVPWTCSRSKSRLKRNSSLSDTCSSSETSDSQCNEPNMQRTASDNSDSLLADNITVKRPTCSNSHISFILGGSDTEDEDALSHPDDAEDANELWDFFINCSEKLNCSFMTNTHQTPPTNQTPTTHQTAPKPPENPIPSTPDEPDEEILYKSPSKVKFADKVTVHPMVVWSYAYRAARQGGWDSAARDRKRFSDRVRCVGKKISWCFEPAHRRKMHQLIHS